MFRIRSDQMAAMEAVILRRFRQQVLRQIKSDLPEKVADASDEEVLAQIDEAISRGGKYGLKTERDLHIYTALTFVCGLGFETQRSMNWARQILSNADLEPSVRVALVHQRISAAAETVSTPA